jgi:beta-ketoacyl synthase-like protein
VVVELVSYGLEIESWAFWSPETRDPREWHAHWRRAPAGPLQSKIPEDAIPAMHKRRMSALSKMAVQIALEARGAAAADSLVFCSQHGELARTRELLRDLANGVELSPTAFSQSVHNTSAGLYTIIAQSRAPASSLASGASTFAYGWLEAEGLLLDKPESRALLVSYDEALPEEYEPFSSAAQCTYALGLLLRARGGSGVTLQSADAEDDEALPLAPLFMAWALSAQREMRVTAEGQGWVWSRDGA